MPYPPDSGERIRNYHLMRSLARTNTLSLLSLVFSEQERQMLPEVLLWCSRAEAVGVPKRSKPRHAIRLIPHLLSGRPLDSYFVDSGHMLAKIGDYTALRHYDIIQIEHSIMAPYIRAVAGQSTAKTVLTFHNVGFLQYRRMFKTERNPYRKIRHFLNWLPMERYEARIAERFDACVVTSPDDRRALLEKNSGLPVEVVPNGVDTEGYVPLEEPESAPHLLFMGKMDYEPNIDAVVWFAQEIFPLIRQEVPDCVFTIAGGSPVDEVQRLASVSGITVTGYVQDIQCRYKKCGVVVTPLRSGGGTRLKILEAMALGRPVVSTTVGCEGLHCRHNEHLLIADTPELFARQVIDLLSDRQRRQRLAAAARSFVESRFAWTGIAGKLQDFYRGLAAH